MTEDAPRGELVSDISSPLQREHRTDAPERETPVQPQRLDRFQRFQVFFSTLTAIFTFAIIFIAYQQWERMLDANKIALTAARHAERVAGESLRLTRESNEFTRQSNEAAQRAWVLLVGHQPFGIPRPTVWVSPLTGKMREEMRQPAGMEYVITSTIKNYGRSPARNVRARFYVQLHDRLPDIPSPPSAAEAVTQRIIGPDQSLLVSTESHLSLAEYADVTSLDFHGWSWWRENPG